MLTAWEIDPAPTVGVGVTALLYLLALQRVRSSQAGYSWRPRAGRPPAHPAAFGVGLLILLVSINGPPDSLSESSFSAHMVQHLLIQLVAAPLLILGAPLTLLLRADTRWLPRRTLARVLRSRAFGVVSHPVVAFTLFAAVLVGSHLTPIYNMALEYQWPHQVEHLGYLLTALMFWWPAIGIDPGRHQLAHPARVLYLLLIMPIMAFLGVAIVSTGRVLYPYYATHPPRWGATPLSDQGLAGTLMWVSGMLIITPAAGVALLRWLDQDALDQARREATQRPVGGKAASATVRSADLSFEE